MLDATTSRDTRLARATAGTPLSDAIINASRALALAALERAEEKQEEAT